MALVVALDRHDIEQHVLISDVALARRLAACQHVTVGPIVNTPVMAYCLMPAVEIVHIHESRSGQAGLLLTLTSSIPFVITTARPGKNAVNPLTKSVLHRAALTITREDTEPGNQTAREHLSIYQDVVAGCRRSA